MNNKKILFIAYDSIKTPLLYSQGIPLLREISKKGYSSAIVTFEFEKLNNEKYYKDLMDSYGIKWFKIKHISLHIGPKSSFDIIKGIIKIFFVVLKYKYNIIHCRSYIAGFIGLIVAKLTGRKHIFDMRGLFPDEYVLSGYIQKRGKYYNFYKFLEFIQVKFSNAVVVTSNRFASYIKRLYNKKGKNLNSKLFIIYNSADLNRFKYSDSLRKKMREELQLEDKFVFVYSGSLAKWSLWKQSIYFFHLLSKEFTNLFFIFLTYSDKKIVKNILSKYKIYNYLVLTAYPDEVINYLIAADIGIIFYKYDIPITIASPVKFGEYLASGLPVIVNTGLMDVAQFVNKYKIGIVYSEDELSNEKNIISKFREFRKIYNQDLKKRCIDVAEKHFDLKNAIDEYLKIYKTV